MRDMIAQLVAAALRPIVTEAMAGFQKVAILTAILVGCGLLAVVALIGLLAAGVTMLAPVVGPTTAVALGAAALLLASAAGALWARHRLVAQAAPPAPPAPALAAKPEAGPAPAAKPATLDPVLITAACAAVVLIAGPWRLIRTARRTVDILRLGTSLLAGAELLRTFGPLLRTLTHPPRAQTSNGTARPHKTTSPGATAPAATAPRPAAAPQAQPVS